MESESDKIQRQSQRCTEIDRGRDRQTETWARGRDNGDRYFGRQVDKQAGTETGREKRTQIFMQDDAERERERERERDSNSEVC